MRECNEIDDPEAGRCPICSGVPEAAREAFRATLERLSFDDTVCDACLVAFFRNLGFPVSDTNEPASDDSKGH